MRSHSAFQVKLLDTQRHPRKRDIQALARYRPHCDKHEASDSTLLPVDCALAKTPPTPEWNPEGRIRNEIAPLGPAIPTHSYEVHKTKPERCCIQSLRSFLPTSSAEAAMTSKTLLESVVQAVYCLLVWACGTTETPVMVSLPEHDFTTVPNLVQWRLKNTRYVPTKKLLPNIPAGRINC